MLVLILNEYNGIKANKDKKFFIVTINKDALFEKDSEEYDNDPRLIYEIFSTNGNRYISYSYNAENKEYCFEINENDSIEYVTIKQSGERLGAGEFFKRTINVLNQDIEPSMKLDELEFKQSDTIPIDYINIEQLEPPDFITRENYTYLENCPEINKSIYFDFHLPYIYIRDLDGSFLDLVKMNDDKFLKFKDDKKLYADTKIVNKYLDTIKQVNENRKKAYKLNETITKIINNNEIQKKIEIQFDSAYYSYEYNGKKAENNKKFFIIRLKKFNLEGFYDIENKEMQGFKRDIIHYITTEDGTNYKEYEYYSENDTYCFEIDKNETITSLVVGTEKYYNADVNFYIGENFERTISVLNQ